VTLLHGKVKEYDATMRVDRGGWSLDSALEGSADPVAVLVHGLASTKATWDVIAAGLTPFCRVLRFDLRGHGASGVPAGPCTLHDLDLDLVAVLDAHGIASAIVVGHSGGGVIAMHTAVHHPARVGGLVLVATASEANARAARWYEEMASKAEARGASSVLADFGWSAEEQAPQPRAFAAMARAMATVHADPLTPRLTAIDCPTAVLVGDKDFIGAGGSVLIHRAISASSLEILPGVGHALHLEAPAMLIGAVRRMIEVAGRNPAAAGGTTDRDR
jgi:3-oxoadipate enol-lactonase